MPKGNRTTLGRNAMPETWQPLIEACGGATEFADACGVNRSTLSRWAHGAAVTTVNATRIRELAAKYDVAVPAFEEGRSSTPILASVADAIAPFGTAAGAARALGMSPALFGYHARSEKMAPRLIERLRAAIAGQVE